MSPKPRGGYKPPRDRKEIVVAVAVAVAIVVGTALYYVLAPRGLAGLGRGVEPEEAAEALPVALVGPEDGVEERLAAHAGFGQLRALRQQRPVARPHLGLELFADTPKGRVRLKYAAPSDVAENQALRERLVDLDERRSRAMRDGDMLRTWQMPPVAPLCRSG